MKKNLLLLASCVLISASSIYSMKQEEQEEPNQPKVEVRKRVIPKNAHNIRVKAIGTQAKVQIAKDLLSFKLDFAKSWNSWTGLKGFRYLFAGVGAYAAYSCAKDAVVYAYLSWYWSTSYGNAVGGAALAGLSTLATVHLLKDYNESELQTMKKKLDVQESNSDILSKIITQEEENKEQEETV